MKTTMMVKDDETGVTGPRAQTQTTKQIRERLGAAYLRWTPS